ncbi:AraC family transcriptional regulator [Marinifilum sp. JC120]|nr:AraC family transcriptional regulator [Marinifilum sp. JC120]
MDKYILNVSHDTKRDAAEEIQYLSPSKQYPYGKSKLIELRPGFSISIERLGKPAESTVQFEIDQSPIQFGFLTSGHTRASFYNGQLRGFSHEMPQGSNGISYLPETKGIMEQDVNSPMCTVTILVTPARLLDFIKDDLDSIPSCLRSLTEGHKEKQFVWYGADHPSKRILLQRILDCPYGGNMRNLFYEGTALEIIAGQLHECITERKCCNSSGINLNPSDVERIRAARDFLVNDLENPPTLMEIAQHVGVNDNKLKRGFKAVFGNSVFGYYRDFRMDKAREYLEKGDITVSEAAYRIGYISLGHFSKAFSSRFGVTPKKYLYEHRDKSTARRIALIN